MKSSTGRCRSRIAASATSSAPPVSTAGAEGAKAHSVIRRADGGEEVIPSKAATTLRKGDRLVIETAGGGGYGDPGGRPAEHVRADVQNGKVSDDAARTVYGQARDSGAKNTALSKIYLDREHLARS